MLAELATHKGQTGGSKPAGMRKGLQAWAQKQRQQKKLFDQLGTESGMTMTQDRVAALDDIGFPWASQAGTGPPKKKKQR